jgi:ArsR family transcriptional regulator
VRRAAVQKAGVPPAHAEAANELDEVLVALASSTRRSIVRVLSEAPADRGCPGRNEVCACKFAERLGLAPSTVSHHMGVLVRAGLVSARKDGLWVHYSLDRGVLAEVAEELKSL